MSQLDKDDKKKICTYSLIPADKLKKVDFIDFVKLYDNIHSRDYEYIALHQFYGFRILFFPESIFWKKGLIYPVFPWNEFMQKNYIETSLKYTDDEEVSTKLNSLEKENKLLKKKLKNLTAMYGKRR